MTNEILANQNQISALNLLIERLNNDKKDLQTELKSTENILANVRKELKETKTKNENLLKIISDDELKFMKISQDLDETKKEKNLIGLQLVRRNDEIVLLKEKLNITQTALDQGALFYSSKKRNHFLKNFALFWQDKRSIISALRIFACLKWK